MRPSNRFGPDLDRYCQGQTAQRRSNAAVIAVAARLLGPYAGPVGGLPRGAHGSSARSRGVGGPNPRSVLGGASGFVTRPTCGSGAHGANTRSERTTGRRSAWSSFGPGLELLGGPTTGGKRRLGGEAASGVGNCWCHEPPEVGSRIEGDPDCLDCIVTETCSEYEESGGECVCVYDRMKYDSMCATYREWGSGDRENFCDGDACGESWESVNATCGTITATYAGDGWCSVTVPCVKGGPEVFDCTYEWPASGTPENQPDATNIQPNSCLDPHFQSAGQGESYLGLEEDPLYDDGCDYAYALTSEEVSSRSVALPWKCGHVTTIRLQAAAPDCLHPGMTLAETLSISENTCYGSGLDEDFWRRDSEEDRRDISCAITASGDGTMSLAGADGGPCDDTHQAIADIDDIDDGCVWEVTQALTLNGTLVQTNVNRWVFTKDSGKGTCSAEFSQKQL